MTATVLAEPLPAIDLGDEALAQLTAKLSETAERYDRSGEFPWEPIVALHEAGVLRFGVPEEFGGQPIGVTDATRLLYALGKGDPSVALIASMTIFTHVMGVWPDELYAGVVRESLEHPVLFNHIRAEPELGAPARGGVPATKVRRSGNGWLLNGHKAYGTGSEGLTYHLVWAATEDDEPLQGHAIVPGDHPGIQIVKTWDHLGMRASSTHDIVYRDIELPLDHFHGEPFDPKSLTGGGGADRRSAILPGLGLAIAALYVGVARAAQEFFVRFAHERVPSGLGKPIATTERIQSIAGEIEAQLIQADEVLFGLAARVDAGEPQAIRRAPFAKLLATRNAITAVQTAVAALGNPALTRSHPLERHLRDVLCCRIHPPQDDAALIALGKQSLAAA